MSGTALNALLPYRTVYLHRKLSEIQTFPFFRWENWGSERLKKVPKVAQLESSRIRIHTLSSKWLPSTTGHMSTSASSLWVYYIQNASLCGLALSVSISLWNGKMASPNLVLTPRGKYQDGRLEPTHINSYMQWYPKPPDEKCLCFWFKFSKWRVWLASHPFSYDDGMGKISPYKTRAASGEVAISLWSGVWVGKIEDT